MSDPHQGPDDVPTFAPDAATFAPDAATFAPGAATVAAGVGVVTSAPLPTTIGRYRIVRLIGEGGMGAVYEAEQDQPRRTVALKVIKPGLANAELLRRFAQEAQALGRLQHPGIAQIYDAGTADAGAGSQPYFAMEFIRGETLRAYVEAHQLPMPARLELMVKVCDAVHHAHQRGLIHRDLKPGNIIVDNTGQPKILDFGVARVTDSDAQATMQTDVGQLVGTLSYMSPEQVLADPLDIDTRSDVYALGVILYELLAGRLPYDISKRLHEAMQTIREQDPSKLSSIDRRYRGDVETIAAKALEKDKSRRYASAAELGGDITRFLRDEPIIAQPPTTRYQLQKFARRHKALVGGLAAVLIVLAGGMVVSTWQAVRASRAEAVAVRERDRAAGSERAATAARDEAVAAKSVAVNAEGIARQERDRAVSEKERADTEAATAKAVSEFLQKNLFEQVTGGTGRGTTDVSVSGALDRTAARIDGAFTGQPLVEAGVRETVARAYIGLSTWAKAVAQLDGALAIRRRVQGAEDADTLKTLHLLATVDASQRRWPQAEARLAQVLEAQRRRFGADNPDTLRFTLDLATYYLQDGKPGQAQQLAAQAAEGSRRTLGLSNEKTIDAMLVEAVAYEQGKRFPEAKRVALAAFAASRQALGEKNPTTNAANSLLQRIDLQLRTAAPGSAATARADFLAGQARTLASANVTSLPEMVALAAAKATNAYSQNKPEEAIPPLLEAIEAARRAGQEEYSLSSILSGIYASTKRLPDAEQTLAPVLARPEPNKDLMPNVLAFGLRGIATALRNDRRYAEAEPYFAKLVPLELIAPGEGVQQTRIDAFLLADVLFAQGKYQEAERAFSQLLEMQRRAAGPQSLAAFSAQATVGWTQQRLARLAEAEKTVREALDGLTRVAPDSWERFSAAGILGSVLAAQNRVAEAEPLLTSGYEGMTTRRATTPNAASRFGTEEASAALTTIRAGAARRGN